MEQLLFPDFVSECASSVKRLSAAYQICHKFMIIQISATLPHHRSKDLFKVLRIILNYYVGSLYENITLGHCQERLKQVRHKVWRETKNRIKILIEIALSFYFGSHLAILNASSDNSAAGKLLWLFKSNGALSQLQPAMISGGAGLRSLHKFFFSYTEIWNQRHRKLDGLSAPFCAYRMRPTRR